MPHNNTTVIYNGFDFGHERFFKNSPQRQRFYKSNYDKPITLEEFTAEVKSWPRKDRKNSQSRSPSACKSEYNHLVREYGFFPGGQRGSAQA